MKVFDNYEISPCTRFEEPEKPGHFYFEVCKPEEADVWTLYGHINGEGVQAIGDFDTREHAEEAFQRITGIPFADSREVSEHLRVMYTGQKLLAALKAVREAVKAEPAMNHQKYDALGVLVNAAISEATGRAA
jgi:hypothetical protein